MTTVSVEELQRAWAAIEAGNFRANARAPSGPRKTSAAWEPKEPLVVVLGAAGRVGTSTVALGVATAGNRATRLLEFGSMHDTAFASATTAELGVNDTGWRQGHRGDIVIERTTSSFEHPAQIPMPDPTSAETTVIDVGWDLAHAKAADSWLSPTLETSPLIIASVATVPGLRALDTALAMTARSADTTVAILGPRRKKWPRTLEYAMTRAVSELDDQGRLFVVPYDSALALNGLTSDPLPNHVLAACHQIFDQTVGTTKGNPS